MERILAAPSMFSRNIKVVNSDPQLQETLLIMATINGHDCVPHRPYSLLLIVLLQK
jgi:hypothetical protein